MNGTFITFEGTEASGKSTQIQLLEKRLALMGRKVRVLREPGGTRIGEQLRAIFKDPENKGMVPETELLILNASRAQLVREVIVPAIKAGEIVICDRFYDSTVAYQGYGRNIPWAPLQGIISFAVGNLVPDITFLLIVPLEESMRRQEAREKSGIPKDRMEGAARDFFDRVENGFETIAAHNLGRIVRINGDRSIPVVEELIWQKVRGKIELPYPSDPAKVSG